MSMADGEAEKDGEERNRWRPETVSRRSVMTVGNVWHKILFSARCLTVYSSLRQPLRASRQAQRQPAVTA